MFENMTFDGIMDEMMADMPEGVSTVEGSLIWNACAKMAVRLEEAAIYAQKIEQNMSIDTADIDHLIILGADRSVEIRNASYAIMKARCNTTIPIGTRFNCKDYNYITIEELDAANHEYALECETAGSAPNTMLGELTLIDYVAGFSSGEIVSAITPGRDREETEAYRQRLIDSFGEKAFGGNRQYYIQEITDIEGVGGVKVKRRVDGDKYIHITIIGGDYRSPSEELLESVQTAVDPEQNDGNGDGIAPIGHFVLIEGVEEEKIDITTTLTYEGDNNYEGLKSYIEKAIDDYLLELRKTWDDTGNIVVRISQLESALLDVNGIIDVQNTQINGSAQNLELGGKIPIKGTVTAQ